MFSKNTHTHTKIIEVIDVLINLGQIPHDVHVY